MIVADAGAHHWWRNGDVGGLSTTYPITAKLSFWAQMSKLTIPLAYDKTIEALADRFCWEKNKGNVMEVLIEFY